MLRPPPGQRWRKDVGFEFPETVLGVTSEVSAKEGASPAGNAPFLGLVKYRQDWIRPTFLEQTDIASFQLDFMTSSLLLSRVPLIPPGATSLRQGRRLQLRAPLSLSFFSQFLTPKNYIYIYKRPSKGVWSQSTHFATSRRFGMHPRASELANSQTSQKKKRRST